MDVYPLNHHHLYIFWIFAKTSSFTRAAEELSIAQSAVTSQIRSLESQLGLSLVDRRNPRRPQITEEGRKTLAYADVIFESSRELASWAQKGVVSKVKRLRIGAISGLSRNLQFEFIRPLLGDNNSTFEATTDNQKNLVQMLMQHEIDVVLTSQNVSFDNTSRLMTEVLTTSAMVCVANPKLKIRKSRKLEEILAGQNLIVPGKSFEAKPELNSFLERLKVKPKIIAEIDDVALLRVMALKSEALVIIPKMGVKIDLERGEVKLLGKVENIHQRYYAITRPRLNPQDEIVKLISQLRQSTKAT